MNYLILKFTLITISVMVKCDHYKGGVFSSFLNDDKIINIKYQLFYRRTGSASSIYCDNSLIQSQELKQDGNANRVEIYYCNSADNCYYDTYLKFDFKCINYDVTYDWSAFENYKSVNVNRNLMSTYNLDRIIFVIYNNGGAWSKEYWSEGIVYSWIHMNKLISFKNKTIQNVPPEVLSFPNHNIKCGCESKLKPTIINKDNDIIKCRKSVYSIYNKRKECGSCSNQYTIDTDSCILTFPANLRNSLVVEIQIEDYNLDYMNGTKPMSSTSYQFTVILGSCSAATTTVDCNDGPKFTDSIQPSGSCIAIRPGTTYNGRVEAYSMNKTIKNLQIYADFIGFQYDQSQLLFNTSNKISYYNFNVSDRDQPGKVYQGMTTFKATDSSNQASDEHSINYLLNYEPPEIIEIIKLESIYCIDKINLVEFILKANRNISKPIINRNAHILFVRDNFTIDYSFNTFNSTEIKGNMCKFKLNKNSFKPNNIYSVLFEMGAFITDEYCGPFSEKMFDLDKFKFQIVDDSSVGINFNSINNVSKGNMTIEYLLINANVTDCFLKHDNEAFEQVNCSKSKFEIYNLQNGNYTFYLKYKTICDQLRDSNEIKFKIVNQKPLIQYETNGQDVKKMYASNKFNATLSCKHPIKCSIQCRLISSNENLTVDSSESCDQFFKPSISLVNGFNYILELLANDELNNTNIERINFRADTEPPKFLNFENELNLNCGNVPNIPNVTDNLDTNPSISYKDSYVTSCQITRQLTTTDHVGNIKIEQQKLVFKSESKLIFPNPIKIGCVDNKQVINDLLLYTGFISLDNNKCNTTLKFKLDYGKLPVDDCDFVQTIKWTVSDECNLDNNVVLRQEIIVDQRQIPYSPLLEQENVDIRPWFKWPIKRDYNKQYELRIRKSNEELFLDRIKTKTNEYRLNYKLEEFTSYSWNVFYFSDDNQTVSASWTFKTKRLADLSILSITVPPNDVLPEEIIQISWQVKNIGQTVTSSSLWYDSIYGGESDDFSKSFLLGRIRQNRFLEPNGTYSSSFKFSLNERFKSDKYFIFIIIDNEIYIEDSNFNNNKYNKMIGVKKPLLPNLIAKSIQIDETAIKAGKIMTFKYTVENLGESDVKPNKYWSDLITIKFRNDNLYRKSFSISNDPLVKSGSNYSIANEFILPKKIYDQNASIEINTNYNDLLYESSLSDNTFIRQFNILPPDTPDLNLQYFNIKKYNFKTGEILVFNYFVVNEGIEDATEYSWQDEAQLKLNNIQIYNQVLKIYGPLLRQEKYNRELSFFLPHNLNDGIYTVELRVDKSNNIFVYSPGSTSTRFSSFKINITRSIPTWQIDNPQVKCSQVKVDNSLVNRLELSYNLFFKFSTNLKNKLVWTDEIYLSDRSYFDVKYATKLAELNQELTDTSQNDLSTKDLFYYLNSSDQLAMNGNLFVYFVIDSSNLNEKIITNNPFRVSVNVPKIISNVNMTYLKVNPANLENNYFKVNLLFGLINTGPNLIKTAIFNINAKYENNNAWNTLKEITVNDLVLNIERSISEYVNLDKKFNGKVVFSIQEKNKFDFNFNSNQLDFSSESYYTNSSTEIEIVQPKSVDFSMTKLNVILKSVNSDNLTCDQNTVEIHLNYTVKNIGFDMKETQEWYDYVSMYCGKEKSLIYSKNIKIANFLRNSQSYINSLEIKLQKSNDYDFFDCSLNVASNNDNGVFEIFSKANNAKIHCCFSILKNPSSILTIKLANETKSINLNSSDSFQISYYFTNDGLSSRNQIKSWVDGFYLANETSIRLQDLNSKGILIGTRYQANFDLYCGLNSSIFNLNAYLSSNLNGAYYAFVVHDIENPLIKDSNKTIKNLMSVYITKSKPCDLRVNDSKLLNYTGGNGGGQVIEAGSKINFYFEITNIGEGKAKGSWFDAIYLSPYPIVTSSDIKLLTQKRVKELNQNESYRIAFELKIPLTLKSGEYFLIMQTDSLNIIDDSNRENNQNYIHLNLLEQPSGDLFLKNLTIQHLMQTNSLIFEWFMSANRQLNAQRCDTYYLSLSPVFDYDSFELSNGNCESFSIKQINPNELSEIKAKKILSLPPLILDGNYYGIARSISNIYETNYSNNAVTSNETIQIDIQELEFEKELIYVISANREALFKFNVNMSITMFQVNLNTNTTISFHDLFINEEKLPQSNVYIAKSLKEFSYNQTSIVRNAKPTVHYVLIKPYMSSQSNNINYSISLIVKQVKPIQVDTIFPSRVNNRGWNTLKLNGNFEPNILQVCLKSNDGITNCAKYVYKISKQIVYARFDMENFSDFQEDLNLLVNNVKVNQILEVVNGVLGSIKLNLKFDNLLYRPNQTVFATIEMLNPGDSDSYVPITLLTTFEEKKIQNQNIITPDILTYIIKSINNLPYYSYPYDHLFLYNENGLGSVLQAHSTASIRLEIRPLDPQRIGSQSLNIQEPKSDFLKILLEKKINSFKYNWISDTDWLNYSSHFIEKIIQNSNEFIYETVNLLSSQSIKTFRFDDIINYHLNRLDNSFLIGNLVNQDDLEISPMLKFTRSYPTRTSRRLFSKQNSMGFGWTDNLNIKLIKSLIYDTLLVTIYGDQFEVMFKRSDTFYFSEDFQIEYNEAQKYALIYWKKENLLITYNLNTNCVQEFETADQIKYSVVCDNRNGFIKKISNNLVTIQFTYSIRNCLTSINKINSDGTSQTVLYNYDNLNRLIAVKSLNLNESFYYDARNNLIKIKNDQFDSLLIDYNNDNLFSKINKYSNSSLYYSGIFEYFNYGPFKVTDLLTNTFNIYLFDYRSRLVYVNTNDESDFKLLNNVESKDFTQIYNGEPYQDIKLDTTSNTRIYKNIQNDRLKYRIKKSNEEHSSYETTDYNGNIVLEDKYKDEKSERIETIYPDGSKTTKIQLLNEKKLTFFTRKGDQLDIQYDDDLNRAFYSHATGDVTRKCYYEYINRNLLKLARGTDPFDSIEIQYDSLFRVKSTKSRVNSTTQYFYDSRSGNLIEIKTDNNFNIRYEYNSRNEVVKIVNKLTNEVITNFQYISDNSVEFKNLNDKISHKLKFDNGKNLLNEYKMISDTADNIEYVFEYNLKKLHTKTIKKTQNNGSFMLDILYDSLDRPVYAFDNETQNGFQFKFDANGNRKEFQLKSNERIVSSTVFTVNNLDQYTENTQNKFEYNLNGLLIKEKFKANDESSEYKYSDDGKLINSINKEDNCTYTYDCLEKVSIMQCVKKGKFVFYYHYNKILENKISHVVLPNKTVLFFVHVQTFNIPNIQIISSISVSQINNNIQITNHLPILKPDLIQMEINPPSLIPGTTITPINPMPTVPNKPNPGSILPPDISRPPQIDKPINPGNIPSFPSLPPLPPLPSLPTLPPLPSMPSLPSLPNLQLNKPTTTQSSLSGPCSWQIFGGKKYVKFLKKQILLNNNTLNNKNLTNYNVTKSLIGGVCAGVAAAANSALNGGSAFNVFDSFANEAIPFYSDATLVGSFLCGNAELKPNALLDYIKDKIKDKIKNGLLNLLPASAAGECSSAAGGFVVGVAFNKTLNKFWNWTRSFDPNDISGPDGYGYRNFTNKETLFEFKIRFENMNTTIAPAQIVKINSNLSDLFDFRTVQFTGYGFNQYSNNFATNKRSYINDIIKMENNDQVEIRLFATIDLKNLALIWKFSTIDKNTGDIPEDASIGFLPPNNGTHGEGYVSFEIKLSKTKELHLKEATATASIIFDNNEPIETNLLTYTIDSEAPVLQLEFKNDFILINATDNGSEIKNVRLYNNETLILELNDENFYTFELEPRNEPYLIYGSAEDNVGNRSPNKFYFNVTVSKEEKIYLCLNNCSNNGNCNSKYGICECNDKYSGSDCSELLSMEQLLSRPIDYKISYYESDRKNEFNLNLYFQNETYDMLFIEINQKKSKLNNRYNDFEFIFNNETYSDNLKLNTTDQLSYLNFKIKSKKSQNLIISFNLTSFRFNEETNETVANSNLNDYELYLKTFIPETFIKLNESACYDFTNGINNRIEFFVEDLNDLDDDMNISVNKLSQTFIQFKEGKNFFYVNSSETFDQIDLTVEFRVGVTEENLNFTIIKQFNYKKCKIADDDDENTDQNDALTISLIVIGAILSVGVILFSVVIIKNRIKRKRTEKKEEFTEMSSVKF